MREEWAGQNASPTGNTHHSMEGGPEVAFAPLPLSMRIEQSGSRQHALIPKLSLSSHPPLIVPLHFSGCMTQVDRKLSVAIPTCSD